MTPVQRKSSQNSPPSGGGTQVAPPIKPSEVTEDSNGWAPPGHCGLDLITDGPRTIYAPIRSKVVDARNSGWYTKGASGDISKGDGVVRVEALEDWGNVKRGMIFGFGHAEGMKVSKGQIVEAGTPLAHTGYANAWHAHFFVGKPGIDTRDGCLPSGAGLDPKPFWDAFKNGQAPLGEDTASSGGGAASGLTAEQVASISKASAFATLLELPGLFDSKESMSLTGKKSLMNDQPLLPFIQQMCAASLRRFQSMPNGKFFAFFPDYFGGLDHRTPYWEINDVEILDGKIDLSDDPLATHVFVVGDIASSDYEVTIQDKMNTGGIVTIFDAFGADFLNGLPPAPPVAATTRQGQGGNPPEASTKPGEIESPTMPRTKALAFLQKYGARPHFEEAPMVRNTFYEMFLAYQKFCLLWAQQFATTFQFTYMPELFPGGLISFPDHGIKCFVEEVTHSFDYEGGFTTSATLTAPSSLSDVSGNVNVGMIRDFALDDIATLQAEIGNNPNPPPLTGGTQPPPNR